MLNIKVILGSTREGRFSEKPGRWILGELKKHQDIDAELLDLRDFNLPFFDQSISPSTITQPYSNEEVRKWTSKIAEADGFVILAPEYNHSFPAVLKNALDWVYKEWNKKAIGFVSYGSVMGARTVEQLRLVAIEVQMEPIRASVHIPGEIYLEAKDEKNADPFKSLNERANQMIEQLIWWTKALKEAREKNY